MPSENILQEKEKPPAQATLPFRSPRPSVRMALPAWHCCDLQGRLASARAFS